ncbi:PepSY-associated TM helix domain-containing protein [Variovorax terrae]
MPAETATRPHAPRLRHTDRPRRGQRYPTFMRWVRKSHGWIGLWGAALGLLFGFSGIWLNHRAVLKLPPFSQQRINGQIELPGPAPASAAEMQAWLQAALGLAGPANAVRIEPARPVAWADKAASPAADTPAHAHDAPLMQPEHWVFSFGGPQALVQADYWRGNHSVGVTTTRSGLVGTLTNMHKGTGMPLAWILLVDTLAGSLILLSVSGVLLWMQTNPRRMAGAAIAGTSLALTLGLALARF